MSPPATYPAESPTALEAGIVGRQAASRYLKALAAAGVLEEQRLGREKFFLHPRLLTLLTRDGNDFVPYRSTTGNGS